MFRNMQKCHEYTETSIVENDSALFFIRIKKTKDL